MSDQATVQPSTVKSQNTADLPHRLPCRGCKPTCKNFATCGGKPWRSLR